MTDISVIICTHNPRPDYLGRVLDALAVQTLPNGRWELLLIDNASDAPLAEIWDLSWHPSARHIREDELGLTPARVRGIQEARGGTLVYVDDDNLLAPDYLETALGLLTEHPYLGVIGAGIVQPEFEIAPSPELVPHLEWLALHRVLEPLWSINIDDNASLPIGAGVCVTRGVADAYVRLLEKLGINQLLDRHGGRLFGHGDIAFSWTSAILGLGFGIFPTLCVVHLIRGERLTQSYFIQLLHDTYYSAGVSGFLWKGRMPGDNRGRGEQYLRLCLRCIRRGPFAMRLGWAALRGTERAKAFIKGQRLRPLAHRHL